MVIFLQNKSIHILANAPDMLLLHFLPNYDYDVREWRGETVGGDFKSFLASALYKLVLLLSIKFIFNFLFFGNGFLY